MLQTGKLKIRSLKELQADNLDLTQNDFIAKTPLRKLKNPTPASTTKKQSLQENDSKTNINSLTNAVPLTTTRNKKLKSALKEPPPSQKRIDSYFKSCQKSYKIERGEPLADGIKSKQDTATKTTSKSKKKCTTTKKSSASTTQRRPKAGRKRLFVEPESTAEMETTSNNSYIESNLLGKSMIDCITIPSDSEEEAEKPEETKDVKENDDFDLITSLTHLQTTPPNRSIASKSAKASVSKQQLTSRNSSHTLNKETTKKTLSSSETYSSNYKKSKCRNESPSPNRANSKNTSTNPSYVSSLDNNEHQQSYPKTRTPPTSSTVGTTTITKRKHKPCPPYKIIEGTSFAVDAFQFGCIENVTHYFLTHFHADHYIGLNQKFSMPLYMSPITARFVRTFIPIGEQYINILELNEPHIIDNIEITALDANHCPGAVLLVFKFLDTGKCILHTGDFRAWHGMESESIFWNNDIHTIYLDTTYISNKYAFCTQYESIDKAKQLIKQFQETHQGKRILYICGSYVIGKEKFWSSLAEEFEMKVWAEANRYKALKAMEDARLDGLLIEDPYKANMHVIPMVKLSYLHLVDYFSAYEQYYDIVLAIRPSGWEKDSKPQYRGKINIVGVEYSEHSSFSEMQRFVKFLKPQQVLSTVPTGNNLMITAKIPESWYKYDVLKSSSNYQPGIDTIFGKTTQKKKIRQPNMNKGGLEHFVSPLSQAKQITQRELNNNEEQHVISIHSSENDFEQELPGVNHKIMAENEIVKNCEIQTKTKQTYLNKKKQKLETKNQKKSPTPVNLIKPTDEDCSIFIPNPPSLPNSSEYFEMPTSSINKQIRNNKIKTTNLSGAIENNNTTKNKLLLKEPNSKLNKIPENSSTSKVTKLKYQKQKSTTTTSDDDFEIPPSQRTTVLNKTTNSQIKTLENQKPLTTSSEDDMKVPISQRTLRSTQNKQQQKEKSPGITSEEEAEIPISQKTRRPKSSSSNTTNLQTVELEKQMEAKLLKVATHNSLTITQIAETTTSKQYTQHSSLNKTEANPLFKSTTTSNGSTSTDEISATQPLEYTPRRYTNKRNASTQAIYKPTPIKKSKDLPTSKDKEPFTSTFSSLNRTATLNCFISTNGIPANQNKQQLEYTPRPLTNKGKSLTQATYTPTPIKKSNDGQHLSSTPFGSQESFKKIFQDNKDLDFYNPSQMVTIVEETLGKQCLVDNSTDHIPDELLSIPANEDCTSFITNPSSLPNSSEYFETPTSSIIKQKPLNKNKTSNLSGAIENNNTIKNKLLLKEPKSKLNKIPENSSTCKVTKLKYQKQKSTTTTSEDDFEIPSSQRTRILNKTINSQIKTLENQQPLTTSSEDDTKIPISQKALRSAQNKQQQKEKSPVITSEEEAEIPISQKTRRPKSSSSNTTNFRTVELEKQMEAKLLKVATQNSLTITRIAETTTSKQYTQHSSLNKIEANPLFKSTTTSNGSTSTDEISATQQLEYTPRRYTNKRLASTQAIYKPTPIKKSKQLPTSKDKQPFTSTFSSLNKTSTLNCFTSTNGIPANQNKQQLEYSPRPLKNKGKTLTQATYTPTPIKKSHDSQHLSSTPFSSQEIFKKILQENKDLDFYNPSQMATIVEETLGKQCLDNSTDHIPDELLSIPDADDDWMT